MQKYWICVVIFSVSFFNFVKLQNLSFVPHPETKGNHFEGDIVGSPFMDESVQLNGVIDASRRWPKATGSDFVNVPYVIDAVFNAAQNQLIKDAMATISRYTCIRFWPRVAELSYLNFISTADGCYSNLGRTGGAQEISIMISDASGSTCLYLGIIAHEILHALGFYHMQSTFDRDNFVTIKTENIQTGFESQFAIQSATSRFNTPYDFDSVMHYGQNYFSKNGMPTIVPKDPSVDPTRMGQRLKLSTGDYLRVANMYSCWISKGT